MHQLFFKIKTSWSYEKKLFIFYKFVFGNMYIGDFFDDLLRYIIYDLPHGRTYRKNTKIIMRNINIFSERLAQFKV